MDELAEQQRGPDGMTARDVLEHLPQAIRAYGTQQVRLVRGAHGAFEPL
ncbi:MAG: hypothetical protein IPG96_13635 [Proteobacteria bacterium]|nr:hypothetical protein [Pseudomonadota bacterium]